MEENKYITKSESIDQIAVALTKIQAELVAAKKDSSNPFFKSKYADLAEIISVSKDILSKNGISISQLPIAEGDDKAGCFTLLMHVSGQFIGAPLLLQCKDKSAQGMGSAITYARRYSWQSAIGLAAEEDDDGNSASMLSDDAMTRRQEHREQKASEVPKGQVPKKEQKKLEEMDDIPWE